MTVYFGGGDEDDPRLEAMAAEFEAECLAEEAALTDEQKKARDWNCGVDAYEKLEKAFRAACEKDPSMAAMGEHWHWALAIDDTSFSIVSDANAKSEDKTFNFDPDRVREKTLEQLEVILRHEWAHVVLAHADWTKRFIADRDTSETPKVWILVTNTAADLEINSALYADLVSAGLGDEAFVPEHGMCENFPHGLKADDYASLIMASPELMAKMRELA